MTTKRERPPPPQHRTDTHTQTRNQDTTTTAPPPPPTHTHTNLNHVYNLCRHQPTTMITSTSYSTTLTGSMADGQQKMAPSKNRTMRALTHIYSSTTTDLLLIIQYSYCPRNGAYCRHANSFQTSAIHFSPQPHKPHCTGETSMAATLSRAPLLFFVIWQREGERSEA